MSTVLTPTTDERHTANGRSIRLIWLEMLIAGLVAAGLIFSRVPSAWLHAQFYAEEGQDWYAQLHNFGWRGLFMLSGGYEDLAGRLAAAFALLFPLALGPLILHLIALAVQVLPVVLLFSGRFDRLVPALWAKVLLGVIYALMPSTNELVGNMTNAQWHIALLMFLVVIASPTHARGWPIFDGAVIVIGSLSGPTSILLAPVAWLWWYLRRSRRGMLMASTISALAGVQMLLLLVFHGSRQQGGALGASLQNLLYIVTTHIYLAVTIGATNVSRLFFLTPLWHTAWIFVVIPLAGTVFLLYLAWRVPLELRLMLLYGALIFGAGLVSPLIVPPAHTTQWQAMGWPQVSVRYEYVLNLGWIASLLWLVTSRSALALRVLASLLLLAALLIAVPADWTIPAEANMHFSRYVRAYEHTSPGASLTIPVYPPGRYMRLQRSR